MNSAVVIIIGGRIGSGKSSLAELLGETLDCPVGSFGAVVRSEVLARGLVQSRDSFQKVGRELVQEQPREFCRRVIDMAGWQRKGSLVIEGLRHAEILSIVRKLVAPISSVFVFLDVATSIRSLRVSERGDKDQNLEELDKHATEIQSQAHLRELADLVIDGSRDLIEIVEVVLEAVKV